MTACDNIKIITGYDKQRGGQQQVNPSRPESSLNTKLFALKGAVYACVHHKKGGLESKIEGLKHCLAGKHHFGQSVSAGCPTGNGKEFCVLVTGESSIPTAGRSRGRNLPIKEWQTVHQNYYKRGENA